MVRPGRHARIHQLPLEEGANILVDTKQTRESEIEWLAGLLTNLETDKKVVVVAEVDGRFVGQTEVTPKGSRSRHVGLIGVALRGGYRDVGIGSELMREAETQSRQLCMEILQLEVFASNERARHVYEKVGYREAGRWPREVKKDGTYIDAILMSKDIGS
jgi:ribosomal protein S18 acetylase RimI-like enzyme